ncbi:MAG TPA: hypothetical protein VJ783_07655 [Pirellulales bacterium]|nr:hypothetical protein [Pirellulales bacterium]
MNDSEPVLEAEVVPEHPPVVDPPKPGDPRDPAPSSQGYSLASLFLLVTTAGVIAGLARNIAQTQVESWVLAIHAAVGSLLGCIAGAVIGFSYPRRLRGMLLGFFVGGWTGGVCAALAAAGGSPWLFGLGALALLTLGFASRWIRRRDSIQ